MKDYVRLQQRAATGDVRAAGARAGNAQADFGEALGDGRRSGAKAHYLAMDLPQSDDCFVMAFPAETTEAFLEGHVHAFAYFGGVPRHDSVRQHEAGGGADSGRWRAEEDAGILRVAEPLSVCREVRTSGQGQRQGQGGRVGGLRAAELPGADSASGQLGGVERASAGAVPEAAGAAAARAQETIGERFERDRTALLPLPRRRTKPARNARRE